MFLNGLSIGLKFRTLFDVDFVVFGILVVVVLPLEMVDETGISDTIVVERARVCFLGKCKLFSMLLS